VPKRCRSGSLISRSERRCSPQHASARGLSCAACGTGSAASVSHCVCCLRLASSPAPLRRRARPRSHRCRAKAWRRVDSARRNELTQKLSEREQKLHEVERLLHALRQHNIELEAHLNEQLKVCTANPGGAACCQRAQAGKGHLTRITVYRLDIMMCAGFRASHL
jgi:hypothetical protein